jgi:dTDP-glucose 4,6-dehydratase
MVAPSGGPGARAHRQDRVDQGPVGAAVGHAAHRVVDAVHAASRTIVELDGRAYHVPGSAELSNRDVVASILELLHRPWSLVRSVADRPGHDRRYAMEGSRLRALGWANRVGFEEGLAATVAWYREHEEWWRGARGRDWDDYYARQYADRLAGSTAAAETPGREG